MADADAKPAASREPAKEQSKQAGSVAMMRTALSGVLMVAAVAAGCVVVISKRRPSLPMSTDVGAWAVRRPRPIGDLGPSAVSRPMASVNRLAKGRGFGAGRGHGLVLNKQLGNASRCYSLVKPDICERGEKGNASCTDPDDDHRDARASSHFCGERVARTNPCWSHQGRERCMPYFFLLGEMKCGTTTLYKKLAEHPQVVLPRNKEVRYLQQPKYRKHTATWYASNFDSVVGAPRDAVTFDASPTAFNAQAIAPGWTAKWLPDARLVVMLRDPIQRTYS